MSARVSVIVPVLRDTDALRELLEKSARWTPAPDEVIVVSADTDAAVRAVAERFGARVIDAGANRGAQLDAGARQASGDILWFLHADARPVATAIDAILAAVRAGADAGCFRFVFSGERRPLKALLERLIDLRIAFGGIAYGDQGLFATRDAYAASGGFARSPLFEEVPLVRGLRRQGTFRRLATPIYVSPRRWERDGWIRRTLHNRWLATCYMVGVPAARLATRYRGTAGARAETDE